MSGQTALSFQNGTGLMWTDLGSEIEYQTPSGTSKAQKHNTSNHAFCSRHIYQLPNAISSDVDGGTEQAEKPVKDMYQQVNPTCSLHLLGSEVFVDKNCVKRKHIAHVRYAAHSLPASMWHSVVR